MTKTPIPVEVAGENGIRLRGLEWPVAGPPVIFVHDFGADLDHWGSLTGDLAGMGFRVVSLELSGHGLSEGDPDSSAIPDDVKTMVTQTSRVWGPCGLVVTGEAVRGSVVAGARVGAPVHILVSPPEMSTELMKGGEKAMRIIVAGGSDVGGHEAAKNAYDQLPGQRMMMTISGSAERGVALARLRPSILEDFAQFFRQYLAPINMAWVSHREAQSTAESEATSEEDADAGGYPSP